MCLSIGLMETLAFQHTAARRRLGSETTNESQAVCFNTQPPEGGWPNSPPTARHALSFNTQPPEGGWESLTGRQLCFLCFNTQPPEGGWRYTLNLA